MLGEHRLHFAREPGFEIDLAVVEQGLRCGRHGVQLHGRKIDGGQRRRVGLRARIRFGNPAGGGARRRDGLPVHIAADRTNRGDGAHRRDLRQHAVDGLLDLERHGVAAVGERTGGHRFELQRVEPARIAFADVALEGGLFLASRGRDFALARDRRTGGGERQLVERALLLVEYAVDAIDLVFGDDVRRTSLELTETLVIGGFERLEGAQEFIERVFDFGIGDGFGFKFHGYRNSCLRKKLVVIPGRAAEGCEGKGTQVSERA